MAWNKIDINSALWSNVEDESRFTVSEEKHDIVKDMAGSTKRRPGLVKFVDGLPEKIDGMYYWENQDLFYVVTDGDLYSVTETGVSALIGSGLFEKGTKVVWAEVGDTTLVTAGAVRKIFATNGGKIVEYDGTTAQQLTDGDAPTESTFIAVIDTYLVSNDLSDTSKDESFFYSEVAAPTSWIGEFASAEGKPDRLNAIHVGWNELTLFGTSTIEPWYDDEVTPFVSLKSAIIEQGTLSPYTIMQLDNAWFLLNSDKVVIRIDGRQPSELSLPVDDILDTDFDLATASADWLSVGGKRIYLIHIGERTLAYDLVLREWLGDWSFYDKVQARYTAFKGRNFINIKQWGKTFCSDVSQGIIYEVDTDNYQDNGEEIRSAIITADFDHGTSREKRSNELRIKLKRGGGDPNLDEPVMLVRFRDNGSKTWQNYITVPLGYLGDDDEYYSLFDLGSYYSRQYEFVITDNIGLTIASVDENVMAIR